MPQHFDLQDIARLPLPADNVAVATHRIEAGVVVHDRERVYTLPVTIMEGHRFAVQPIAAGEPLLSWGLPFGYATAAITSGDYVCNRSVLEALSTRNLDFDLPRSPNFEDSIRPYALDEDTFVPADAVSLAPDSKYFQGYRRPGGRGVGTRNFIVLLGTTSRTGSFVRQLEQLAKPLIAAYPNIDGIVAVAHTEGGSEHPNNLELLLRTLAGFIVHPNVGAVLAVDYGIEPVTNDMLQTFMRQHDYALDDVPHRFLSLTGGFQPNLDEAAAPSGRMAAARQCHGRAAEEPVAHLQHRPAVRRFGRLLRHFGQPTAGLGRARGDPLWRQRQPGRNRRIDRSRSLHPAAACAIWRPHASS